MNKKRKVEFCSFLDESIAVGSIVWAKLGSYKWWPGMVIRATDCGRQESRNGYIWIFWFGDHKISEIVRKKAMVFSSHFCQMYAQASGKLLLIAVNEALEILASRYEYNYEGLEDLVSWAKMGFQSTAQTISTGIPVTVLRRLEAMKSSNQKLNQNPEPDVSTVHQIFLSDVSLKKVREGLLKIEDVCIACRGNKVEVVTYHPLFEGGLCYKCKENLMENIFAYGDDGKNICCIICAKPGDLLLCDNVDCFRSYCLECIILLLSPEAHQRIVELTPWFCFFCPGYKNESGLLQIKTDWEERLLKFFQPTNRHRYIQEISMTDYIDKKPIKVLSLFDGISTGKLALDSLSIEVDKYYSCEIDADAINVSKLHHTNSIIYLGDITLLTEEIIQSMCPIDLVIGGSPCNDLSLVNPARKGIYDFTGTGHLFFDFFHVLKTVQRLNGSKHVFFLFENVASMDKRSKTVISSFLMQEPVLIDAKYFSSQTRARYFWGNIPGMHSFCKFTLLPSNMCPDGEYQEDKLLNHCLLQQIGRKAMVEKIRTVTTQRNSLIQENYTLMPVEMNGEPDVLWVTELEKVFGFPLHYTDTGNLNISRRRELVGRAWSVPVIKNIFRPLLNFFKCKTPDMS